MVMKGGLFMSQPKFIPLLKLTAKLSLLVLCLLVVYLQYVESHTTRLPVLMYHHIDENASNDMIVSPARFEEQIATLTRAGWHAVTIQRLIDYVDEGTPLPDKPFLITFDDGYTSNLELAAPILQKYGQHAVIFPIGINAGQEVYFHTGEPLSPPRFALAQALPWIESGVIELQSHTYDLHQRESYGISGREGALPLPHEDEAAYRLALTEDAEEYQALFSRELGQELTALAYPFGFCCDLSEDIFAEQGIRVTFTTTHGSNKIRIGRPGSLRQLNRYTITDHLSGTDLLDLFNNA